MQRHYCTQGKDSLQNYTCNTKASRIADRNREDLTSSGLGRRTIQTDFDGGAITSDAGAPLLRQIDQRAD